MFRLSNLIKSTLEDKQERLLNGSIMIWNFTNRCNLLCHHCYSKADANGTDSLSFDDVCQTIPSMIRAGVKFVIFSGVRTMTLVCEEKNLNELYLISISEPKW